MNISEICSFQFGTIEVEPFMIELPIESPQHFARFREKVQKHSGVKYLQMRRVTHRKKGFTTS